MKRHYLIIIFSFVISQTVFGTIQIDDFLIHGEDTGEVYFSVNPLESYFKQKGESSIGGIIIQGNCSALWRGFVATWEIENDSLFLIRVQTDYCSDPTDLDLEKEFGSNRVFIRWYSGVIINKIGAFLGYDLHEREQTIQIDTGYCKILNDNSFLIYEPGKIIPDVFLIHEKLDNLIYNLLDSTFIHEIEGVFFCKIRLNFDSSGKINQISIKDKDSKTYSLVKETEDYPLTSNNKSECPILSSMVLSATKKVLINFPILMRVDSDRYTLPEFTFTYCGACRDKNKLAYGKYKCMTCTR
jgi:hypothetical protein